MKPICFIAAREGSRGVQNKNIRIIGMGGSSLGSEAIYDFLKKKN